MHRLTLRILQHVVLHCDGLKLVKSPPKLKLLEIIVYLFTLCPFFLNLYTILIQMTMLFNSNIYFIMSSFFKWMATHMCSHIYIYDQKPYDSAMLYKPVNQYWTRNYELESDDLWRLRIINCWMLAYSTGPENYYAKTEPYNCIIYQHRDPPFLLKKTGIYM